MASCFLIPANENTAIDPAHLPIEIDHHFPFHGWLAWSAKRGLTGVKSPLSFRLLEAEAVPLRGGHVYECERGSRAEQARAFEAVQPQIPRIVPLESCAEVSGLALQHAACDIDLSVDV